MEHHTKHTEDENGLLLSDKTVMNLLLKGKRRKDISRELGMPLGTVNTCCTRIYKRLGCKNLAELIIKYGSG